MPKDGTVERAKRQQPVSPGIVVNTFISCHLVVPVVALVYFQVFKSRMALCALACSYATRAPGPGSPCYAPPATYLHKDGSTPRGVQRMENPT
jgi:hypothetical protein